MLKTPIVFVCHDFGGVITKEMLWIANNERFYLPIAVRTQLLVFFATPHQESECCPWPDIIFDVALASTELNRSNRRHIITSVIKSGPAGVIDVSERFNQLAGQYRVLNFYPMEENDTVGAIVR
ncbi:hypothetical protein BDZ91DRAFT_661893 [Kalaharituber pfeilii]|nr:hypothetical protein BDZ91DRAFT_661893 [Kalaharituber pfeilii]